MNKKELTTHITRKTELTNKQAAEAIDALFETIREHLEKNEPTSINGFGTFAVAERRERKGINPATKQQMTIPAHKVVKFLPSKKIMRK